MKPVRSVLFAVAMVLLMMVAWGAIGVLLVAVFTPAAEASEPATWPRPQFNHMDPEYRA